MWLAEVGVYVVVTVHYAAMAFLVFGGFLIWRWRWIVWPHLLIIGWALVSLAYYNQISCPLTLLENYFRRLSGAGDMPVGFIDTYITGVLYPESMELGVQVLCGLLVLASYVGAYLRWRHHHAPDTPTTSDRVKLGH